MSHVCVTVRNVNSTLSTGIGAYSTGRPSLNKGRRVVGSRVPVTEKENGSTKHGTADMPVVHPEGGDATEQHHKCQEGEHQWMRRNLGLELAPEIFLLDRPALGGPVLLVVRRAAGVYHTLRDSLACARVGGVRQRGFRSVCDRCSVFQKGVGAGWRRRRRPRARTHHVVV